MRGALTTEILGIDHVQLGLPAAEEEAAHRFGSGTLGLAEVAKPESPAGRARFQCGAQQVRCGVGPAIHPSPRQPAFEVSRLDAVRARLEGGGHPVRHQPEVPGWRRLFGEDPFGNRIEFLQRL